MREQKVIVAQMEPKERREWCPLSEKKTKEIPKRLIRNTAIFSAVSLCIGVFLASQNAPQVQSVMSHLTAGFEYDDSLGRLQFVSNILPESAMVFLDSQESALVVPTSARQTHAWNKDEPWIEYACIGEVSACRDGEVVTVVKNRQGEYTVRVLHDDGYESLYSGLSDINLKAYDRVEAGQQIGTAAGTAAFELRKEGLSVMPVFGES